MTLAFRTKHDLLYRTQEVVLRDCLAVFAGSEDLLQWATTPGETYFIAIGSYNNGEGGVITLVLFEKPSLPVGSLVLNRGNLFAYAPACAALGYAPNTGWPTNGIARLLTGSGFAVSDTTAVSLRNAAHAFTVNAGHVIRGLAVSPDGGTLYYFTNEDWIIRRYNLNLSVALPDLVDLGISASLQSLLTLSDGVVLALVNDQGAVTATLKRYASAGALVSSVALNDAPYASFALARDQGTLWLVGATTFQHRTLTGTLLGSCPL